MSSEYGPYKKQSIEQTLVGKVGKNHGYIIYPRYTTGWWFGT